MSDTANITNLVYDPVGQCIYCGSSDDLSEEHIIAYALAGSIILPDASCSSCSTITGRFEQRCCRLHLDHIRYPLQMPSRKGKKKRDQLPLVFRSQEGVLLRKIVATTDSPIGLCLPTWNPPRLLEGWPPFTPSHIAIGMWRFGPPIDKIEEAAKRVGAAGFAAHFDLPAFARMLAKIGHSYSVACFGVDGFTPLLKGLILGSQEELWGHYVGESSQAAMAPIGLEFHRLGTSIQRVNGIDHLVVRVGLFSRFGAPLYDVAVGTLTSSQAERVRSYT